MNRKRIIYKILLDSILSILLAIGSIYYFYQSYKLYKVTNEVESIMYRLIIQNEPNYENTYLTGFKDHSRYIRLYLHNEKKGIKTEDVLDYAKRKYNNHIKSLKQNKNE